MKYKYNRKQIAKFILDNHGWAVHDDTIKMIFEPAEKCNCKTKYCKHYKSDFDKFLEEEPKIKPLLDNDWKARHRELTEMVTYQDLVFKVDELVERVNKLK